MANIKETDSNPGEDWGQIHSDRFKISTEQKRRLIIVDDFYEDPHAVRDYALKQYYFDDEGYLGMRTRKQHFFDGVKEAQTFRLQETDGTIKKAAKMVILPFTFA